MCYVIDRNQEGEAVESQYSSMPSNDGGIKAFEFLYNWITEHGVYNEEEYLL